MFKAESARKLFVPKIIKFNVTVASLTLMKLKHLTVIALTVLIGQSACKHKSVTPQPAAFGNYPAEISRIMSSKCAISGCHNAASYENAGNLLLDTWEHLFDGGNSGAVVVPYSVDYSSLLYFINTDSSLGPVAIPTMPLDHPPLSKEEYMTIRSWVANGARNNEGVVPFSDSESSRQKVYMVHQSCDIIGVIDVEKNVVMRYIPVGKQAYPESLTYLHASGDGQYVYACFWYNDEIVKIDTRTDKVVATFPLNNLFWSCMAISNDGSKLALTNGDSYELNIMNTSTGSIQKFENTGMVNPLGIAANSSFDTFYIASQYGNTMYKFTNGNVKKISIDGKPLTTSSGNTPDPYEVILSPDQSKYFVSCEKSHEIRVFDRTTDNLIRVIPVGKQPRSLAVAKSKPYLFVPCMEDDNGTPGFRGSVYVIDYNTLNVVKKIEGRIYQPHTISIDERNGRFYVFSRNQNYNGPAPHHQGPCSGRNGYYTVYGLDMLQQLNSRRYEVLVDPFISDMRF